jgi:Cd2+/Zn2+-exporting ATPase
VVALDKTGTLTSGELQLDRVDLVRGDERRLREVGYGLARLSDHPLSRAVRRAGTGWGVVAEEFADVRQTPGKGLEGRVDGAVYLLGSAGFLRSRGCDVPQADAGLETASVWVGGPDLLGHLVFRDELREEAGPLLERLRGQGIRTVMLTGDRKAAAEAIARRVGIEEFRAELSPEEKVLAVEGLKRGGGKVAMVGDGVNDAPVLAAADVGMAMGARGSDAALEQAEVVLMNDRLELVLTARGLSRTARRIIRQNVFLALGTVAVMVCASILHAIPLTLGVAAHEGSTVIVVLNSLRLLFYREPVSGGR